MNLYLAVPGFDWRHPYLFAVLAAGWALLPPLLLHFSLRISKINTRFVHIACIFIYLPVILFVYRGLERKQLTPGIDNYLFGWTSGAALNEWWNLAFIAYFFLYCAVSAALLFVFGVRAREKEKSMLVVTGSFLMAAFILMSDNVLYPFMKNYSLTAASMIMAAWLASVWFFVSRIENRLSYQFSPSHIFENVFANVSDLVLVTDNDGKIIRANRRTLDTLGYEEQEVVGKDISYVINEAEFILKTFVIMRHGIAEAGDVDVHFRNRKGLQVPVILSSMPFGDGVVKSRGILLIGRLHTEKSPAADETMAAELGDIAKGSVAVSPALGTETSGPVTIEPAESPTEQPVQEITASAKEGQDTAEDRGFRNLVEHALVGIFMTLNGKLIYGNRQMADIFGYTQDEISGSIHMLELVDDSDRKNVADRIDKVIRTGKKSPYFTFRGKRKTGDIIDIEAQGLIGEFYGEQVFIGSLYEITERKMLEEAMRHEALHDPLTSLPNRILFSDRLDMAIANAERENTKVAVMFLDLDRFKSINDTFGHSVGDMLLQSAAGVLSGCLRESDSVARLGGDEFTVMLSCVHSEEDAMTVARKILSAVNQKWVIAGHRLYITTSIGISMYPADGRDSESLLRKADTAMYSAKTHGGNNIRFYSPIMDAGNAEQISLENDLRMALDRDELFVQYQPLFDMVTKSISGVEALLRWNHPERGVLMPDSFIPLAEKTGIIVPIGEWTLNNSCAQVKKWHDRGYSSLDLAINISGVQLKESDFVDMVESVLKKTSFDPKRLKLEITENVALQNLEAITPKLERLSNLGVQFAVDDFGMGYSSLHYLKKLPISTVKIDKSFTRNLTKSEEDASIITAVIAMAKSLHLDTVAEGVETREQAAFLTKCRCDSMQGFMYSRPLSPEAFEIFVR